MKESLVLWEVSKKQTYIFASNKLKENRGASKIVEDVMEELPFKVDQSYKDNLVYNGGGSSLYKFKNDKEAKSFISAVSKRILEDYPGIEVFMVIEEYDSGKDNIIDSINRAYGKLGVKKNRREHSGQQVAFGIERTCSATGLPATNCYTEDGQKHYISQEVHIKRKESEGRIEKFENLLPEGVHGTKEFNHLSKGDKNYLAIVHIDGNKMGRKIEALQKAFEKRYESESVAKLNQEYIEALKHFSKKIKDTYEGAFKEVGRVIQLNKEKLADFTYIKEGSFPLIPIILAGDDITYATNGKIAIETARIFLEHMEKLNGEDGIEIYPGIKEPFKACAGVAIAPLSYPFSKTYEMAENLCDNAKAKIKNDHNKGPEADEAPNRDEDPEADYSLIDWHIEQGDAVGSMEEIRERFYIASDGKQLNMRPLYMEDDALDQDGNRVWRTYNNFQKSNSNIVKMEIGNSTLARNKVKKMRDVLKSGEKEAEIFLKSNKLENYFPELGYFDEEIDSSRESSKYCFKDDICMYYDAIEAIDLYEELEGKDEGDE